MKTSHLDRSALRALLLVSILLSWVSISAAAQRPTNGAGGPIPPSEVIQKMVRQNALRTERLKYFTSRRHYHVEFHGIGRSLSADMHV